MEGMTTITVELTTLERERLQRVINLELLITDMFSGEISTLYTVSALNKVYKAITGTDHIKCDQESFNESV